ncbi:MAG: FYDLN acid domain-containing protein [Pseudomonadota bacterium]
MTKSEWGEKRNCGSCQATFYDMQQNPIICPKCSTEFKASAPRKLGSGNPPKVRRVSARKAAKVQLNNDFESQLFSEIGGDDAGFINDTDEFFSDDGNWKEDLRF